MSLLINKSIEKVGPFAFPVAVKGNFHVSSSDQSKIAFLRSGAFCNACHDVRVPNNNLTANEGNFKPGGEQGKVLPPGKPEHGVADRGLQQHQQSFRQSGSLPGLPHVAVPLRRQFDLQGGRYDDHQSDTGRFRNRFCGGPGRRHRRQLSAYPSER